jgi:hypothetical protein
MSNDIAPEKKPRQVEARSDDLNGFKNVDLACELLRRAYNVEAMVAEVQPEKPRSERFRLLVRLFEMEVERQMLIDNPQAFERAVNRMADHDFPSKV